MVALPRLRFPTRPHHPPHPLPIDSIHDITGAEPTIRKTSSMQVATVQTSYNLNGTRK